MEETELGQLVEAFAKQLRQGLGRQSRWALKTALSASETDGIGAVLVVKIPPKRSAELDLEFRSV